MSSSQNSEQYRPLSRGTVIAGRYEIEKYLGESLLGPTYVVKNIETQKLLALKFIRTEYKPVESIVEVKEMMQAARKIQHPNVVRYGNVGEHGQMIFFTQEYFPSINLRQLLIDYQAEDRSFSIREAFKIISKVLEALMAIHEQGIFHTNLKPENILIRQRGSDNSNQTIREIKITDLMAASLLGDDNIDSSPYRAPECRPEYAMMGEKGEQSDVFSVGNILYELLVGRPAQGTYLSPSQFREDLGSSVDNIVDIALSTSPGDRYSTPEDMLRNIQLSFSDALAEDTQQQPDYKNLFITVTAGIAMLAFLGLFFLVRGKQFNDEDVERRDQELRHEVKVEAQALLPSQESQRQMAEKHPDMIYISGGPVLIGSLEREFSYKITSPGDSRAQKIAVDSFYIDRFEYPNQVSDDPNKALKPITGVNYSTAQLVCEKQGKRLCSAYEWEKACRGPENLVYSYGDAYDEDMCASSSEYRLGVEKDCKSGYGVYGLSGGPREWTLTNSPTSTSKKIIKGGDISGSPDHMYRCAFNSDDSAGYLDAKLSFRCCRDAPAE